MNKFTEGYKRYDPGKEGFGNPSDWKRAYSGRMNYEEAKEYFRSKPRTPEQVLEITDMFYTFDYLKQQYRKMIFQHHPDRGGSEERAKEIIAAYEILKHRFGEK